MARPGSEIIVTIMEPNVDVDGGTVVNDVIDTEDIVARGLESASAGCV